MDLGELAKKWLDRKVVHPENTTRKFVEFLESVVRDAQSPLIEDLEEIAAVKERADRTGQYYLAVSRCSDLARGALEWTRTGSLPKPPAPPVEREETLQEYLERQDGYDIDRECGSR